MTVEEIRNSGLLESYIIGNLTPVKHNEVEGYLVEFPELQAEIKEIQRALRAYAEVNGVEPSPELREKILRSIRSEKSPSKYSGESSSNNSGPFFIPFILAGLLALGGLLWGIYKANVASEMSTSYADLDAEYDQYKQTCDSIATDNAELRAMMNTISNPGNRIIQLTPTGKFAGTSLYLHTNNDLQLNYIQAMILPSIAANQAFQLWSLKDGHDPIPLNVFHGEQQQIIPVDFEEGTGTYAITIEDAGGAQVPNLEQLIGTIKV